MYKAAVMLIAELLGVLCTVIGETLSLRIVMDSLPGGMKTASRPPSGSARGRGELGVERGRAKTIFKEIGKKGAEARWGKK